SARSRGSGRISAAPSSCAWSWAMDSPRSRRRWRGRLRMPRDSSSNGRSWHSPERCAMSPDPRRGNGDGPATAVLRGRARSLAEGSGVDWGGTRSSHPELARMLDELKNVETLIRAHRETLGQTPERLDETLPASHPTTWGPLRVMERLGEGSFGEVYRAFDPT